MTAPVAWQTTADNNLKKFFIYVVNRPFYGYEPPIGGSEYSSTGLKLREYSRLDVQQIASSVLNGNAVAEHAIGPYTNLLVVPDHWDGVLPMSSRIFKNNIRFLYFSLLLHPSVIGKSHQQSLQAPIDAAYRIMVSQTGIDFDQDKFWKLDKVALDTSILEQFRQRGPLGKPRIADAVAERLSTQLNGLMMAAPTPDMTVDQQAESPEAVEQAIRVNEKRKSATNGGTKMASFADSTMNKQLHAARLKAATMTMQELSSEDEYHSSEDDHDISSNSQKNMILIKQECPPTQRSTQVRGGI